jgi:hypothetical protein
VIISCHLTFFFFFLNAVVQKEPLKKTAVANSSAVPKAFASFFKKVDGETATTRSPKKESTRRGKEAVMASQAVASLKKTTAGRKAIDSPSWGKGGVKKTDSPRKVPSRAAKGRASSAKNDDSEDEEDVEIVGTRKRRKGTDGKGKMFYFICMGNE